MAELVLETPEGLTLRHDLAGAGSRTAAALVDVALLLATLAAAVVLVGVFAQLDGGTLSGVLGALLLGGVLLFSIALLTLVPTLLDGRTPGKSLLGLRVVDRHGWPASARQHFLRAAMWPIEAFAFVPLPLGVLVMTLLPERQRLGDLVAGTVVLRDPAAPRARGAEAEPFANERWERLPQRRLDLAPALRERFGGADRAFLRDLFARVGLLPGVRRRVFQEAWVHYAGVLGLDEGSARRESPEDAAEALKELYLFLRTRR